MIGEAGGKATVDLIDAVPTAEMQIKNNSMRLSVIRPCWRSWCGTPYANKVPGSKEADFAARFEQIKGGVFLQAFNSLRGGGQITESEGSKATAALLRAQYAQRKLSSKRRFRSILATSRPDLSVCRRSRTFAPAMCLLLRPLRQPHNQQEIPLRCPVVRPPSTGEVTVPGG